VIRFIKNVCLFLILTFSIVYANTYYMCLDKAYSSSLLNVDGVNLKDLKKCLDNSSDKPPKAYYFEYYDRYLKKGFVPNEKTENVKRYIYFNADAYLFPDDYQSKYRRILEVVNTAYKQDVERENAFIQNYKKSLNDKKKNNEKIKVDNSNIKKDDYFTQRRKQAKQDFDNKQNEVQEKINKAKKDFDSSFKKASDGIDNKQNAFRSSFDNDINSFKKKNDDFTKNFNNNWNEMHDNFEKTKSNIGIVFVIVWLVIIGFWCCMGYLLWWWYTRKYLVFKKEREELYNKKKNKTKKFNVDDVKTTIGAGEFAYSIYNDTNIYIDDETLNKMMFIVGATRSGKTISLKSLYLQKIREKKATIVIDGKPDFSKIKEYIEYCKANNVKFYGFGCANELAFDFLNNGTPTEIKDKIINLKDEASWDSDYYKTQAEVYLQTAIEVLKSANDKIYLDDLIEILNPTELNNYKRDVGEKLAKKIDRVSSTDIKDLKGLANELSLLANSDFGEYLSSNNNDIDSFTLLEAMQDNAFVYFALPSLRYPSFAKVLGKLVVNDLKNLLYAKPSDLDIFCFFDEFGVFAGEQVLNLVNQGAGLGLHCAFGTQSIADLENRDKQQFKKQFLSNINTLMVHRINDNTTALELADWIGEDDVIDISQFIGVGFLETASKVSFKTEHKVNKEELKSLSTGEAFLISKIKHDIDKIQVTMY